MDDRPIVALEIGSVSTAWDRQPGGFLTCHVTVPVRVQRIARPQPLKEPPPSNEYPPADRRGGPEML